MLVNLQLPTLQEYRQQMLKLVMLYRILYRFVKMESPGLILAISNLYNFSSLCFISLKYQCSRYFSETFHMEDLPSYCNL